MRKLPGGWHLPAWVTVRLMDLFSGLVTNCDDLAVLKGGELGEYQEDD